MRGGRSLDGRAPASDEVVRKRNQRMYGKAKKEPKLCHPASVG